MERKTHQTSLEIRKKIFQLKEEGLNNSKIAREVGITSTTVKCILNPEYAEKRRAYTRKWTKENKEYRKEYDKNWHEQNREYYLERSKENYQKNRGTRIAYVNKYTKERYKNDPEYRFAHKFKNRIRKILKGISKSKKTLELLGCSISELKNHLQSLFQEGMTWDNYGQFGWHIDHKLPCAGFDLSKPEEQEKCFHYTNLQPLWWLENIQKSDKII